MNTKDVASPPLDWDLLKNEKNLQGIQKHTKTCRSKCQCCQIEKVMIGFMTLQNHIDFKKKLEEKSNYINKRNL